MSSLSRGHARQEETMIPFSTCETVDRSGPSVFRCSNRSGLTWAFQHGLRFDRLHMRPAVPFWPTLGDCPVPSVSPFGQTRAAGAKPSSSNLDSSEQSAHDGFTLPDL